MNGISSFLFSDLYKLPCGEGGGLTFVLLLSARALASYKETWLDTYVQQERQPGKRGQMGGSAGPCRLPLERELPGNPSQSICSLADSSTT